MDEIEKNNGEIIIYRTEDGRTQLEVRLENENVWLSQQQIANLFGVQRPAITKHLKNIFESGELEENSVSSILEHTASDGKNYKTQFYNLDSRWSSPRTAWSRSARGSVSSSAAATI